MSFRCNGDERALILPGGGGGAGLDPGSPPWGGGSRARSTKPRLFQELGAAWLRSGLVCSLKSSWLCRPYDIQRRGLGPQLLKQARRPLRRSLRLAFGGFSSIFWHSAEAGSQLVVKSLRQTIGSSICSWKLVTVTERRKKKQYLTWSSMEKKPKETTEPACRAE